MSAGVGDDARDARGARDAGGAFQTTIDVRFGDVDQAGIVYYPVILHYCHVAFEDFFAGHVGVPYPEMIRDRRLGFPAVRIATTFTRPFTYGMVARVTVDVTHVGRTSAAFRYRFADDANGDALAEVEVTTVCVDMDSFEKVVISDDLRAAFARGAR